MFDRRVVARLRPSSRGAGTASDRALEKPQVQVLVFRYTATVALGDSAPHAVHDRRRPFWFVAVRWPRQAGMTLLTRRPLPSNRRVVPSRLCKPAGFLEVHLQLQLLSLDFTCHHFKYAIDCAYVQVDTLVQAGAQSVNESHRHCSWHSRLLQKM